MRLRWWPTLSRIRVRYGFSRSAEMMSMIGFTLGKEPRRWDRGVAICPSMTHQALLTLLPPLDALPPPHCTLPRPTIPEHR